MDKIRARIILDDSDIMRFAEGYYFEASGKSFIVLEDAVIKQGKYGPGWHDDYIDHFIQIDKESIVNIVSPIQPVSRGKK